jgi:hypothetical protein
VFLPEWESDSRFGIFPATLNVPLAISRGSALRPLLLLVNILKRLRGIARQYADKNFLPASLAALSFVLCAGSIDWGLPSSWHPDEVASRSIRLVGDRTLDPNFFQYPSLHIYLIAGVVVVPTLILKALANIVSGDSILFGIQPGFWNLSPAFLLGARLLTAVMAAATVFLVNVIGRRIFDQEVGVLSAAFLAVSAGFIGMAHFATVDVPMVFWSVLAIAAVLRALDRRSLRSFFFSGVAAGFAASTKYPGVLVSLPLLVGAAYSQPAAASSQTVRGFRIAAVSFVATGAIVGFFCGTPYALLHFPKFAGTFLQLMLYQPVYKGEGTTGYLQHFLNIAHICGNFLGPIAIAGTIWVAIRWARIRDLGVLILLLAITAFYAGTGPSSFCPDRYTLALVPFVLICAAKLCLDGLRAAHRSWYGSLTARLIFGIVLAYTAFYGLRGTTEFARDDRVRAQAWVLTNITPRQTIEMTDLYGLNLPPEYRLVSKIPFYHHKEAFHRMRQSELYRWMKTHLTWAEFVDEPHPVTAEPMEASLESLLARRPEYLILSERCYSRFLSDDPFTLQYFPRQHRLYSSILSNATPYQPVVTFEESDGWLRPKIETVHGGITIYKFAES